MAKSGYAINTEGEVSLSAGVAKTVLGAKAGASVGLDLQAFEIDFDGVTASAEPVLVEVCYCTFATNSPGTASTATLEPQLYGRVIAADFTGGKSWTTEPTVVTVLFPFALDPNKGLFSYDFSLGQTPDCAVAEGFVIRCNAPAAVSCRAMMRLEHT
jgi:hypothetical protein